ncbi:hypothetical protein GGF32_001769 [Allomyces javanicus]|nr:hypothetical protein GGF32_001769 [Allomyces javanicus]
MGPPRAAAPNAPSPLSSVQTATPTSTRSRSIDPTAPSTAANAPYKPLPQAQSRPRAASVPTIPPRLPTMASATSLADKSAVASSSPAMSPPVITTPLIRTASPAGGGPYTARWHQWTTSSSISENDDTSDDEGRGKGQLTDSGHASSADSIPAGTVIAIRANSNDSKLPAVSTPVIQAQPLPSAASAAPAVDSATTAAATPNPAATVATPGTSSTRRPGSDTPAREPRSVLSLAAASSLDDLVAQLCISGRPPAIPSSATASSDSMAPASATPDASKPDTDADPAAAGTIPPDTAAVVSPTPRALDLYLPPLSASLDRSLSLPRGTNAVTTDSTVPDVPVPTPAAPSDRTRPTRPTLAIPPPPSASPPPTAASARAPTLPTPPTSAAPPAAVAASPTAAAKDYYQLVHAARRISSTPGSPPATSTSLVARRTSAADAAAVVSRAVDAVEARVDDRLAQLADENAALRAHVDRVVEELAETQRVHQAMLRDLYAKLEAVQVRDRLLMQHVEDDGGRDRAWSRASSSGSMVAATSSAGSVRGRAMSLESNAVGSVVSSAVAASVRGVSGSVPRASSGLAVSAAATTGKKKRSFSSPFSSQRNSFASSMASSNAIPTARASFSVSGASSTSHRSSWAKISNVAKAVMGLKHSSRRGSAATTASTTAPSTRRGSSPLIHSTTLPACDDDPDPASTASAQDWTHDATLLRALAYHARVLTAADRAAHDLAAVAARYATTEPSPPTLALTSAVGRAAANLWRVLARWPRAKVQEVAAVDGEDERDEDAFEAAIDAGRWPRAATDDESWEVHEMVASEHQRIDRAVREVLGVVDDAVLARVAARLARLALALAVVVRLVMPDVAMYARAPADAAVDDPNEAATEYEPAWHRPADGTSLLPQENAVVESVVFPGLTTDPPLMVLAKSRVLLASPPSTTTTTALRAIPGPAPPSPSPTTPELDAIQTFRRVYALAVRLVDLTLAPASPPTSDPGAIARLIEVSRLVDARRARAAALRGISAALVAAQDRVSEGMDAVHAQLASALPSGVTAGDARARRTRAALLKDMTRVVVLGGGAARTRVFEAVPGEMVDRKVHSVRADDGARTEAVVGGSGMVVAAPVFGGLMRESNVVGERGKVLVKCRVTAAASVRGSFVGPATTPM